MNFSKDMFCLEGDAWQFGKVKICPAELVETFRMMKEVGVRMGGHKEGEMEKVIPLFCVQEQYDDNITHSNSNFFFLS